MGLEGEESVMNRVRTRLFPKALLRFTRIVCTQFASLPLLLAVLCASSSISHC